jgi:hypothetical protein
MVVTVSRVGEMTNIHGSTTDGDLCVAVDDFRTRQAFIAFQPASRLLLVVRVAAVMVTRDDHDAAGPKPANIQQRLIQIPQSHITQNP